jgi:hypothetical protein
MIYVATINSPAGGSEASLVQADLPCTTGLIYQFDLYFPPGPCGLLHVAIFDGGFPVWPSEPGETFFGDNLTLSFPDRYFIRSPKRMLTVRHWNEDDTYDHQFQLRIGQASEEVFIASYLPSMTIDRLRDALAEMGAEEQSISLPSLAEISAGLNPGGA